MLTPSFSVVQWAHTRILQSSRFLTINKDITRGNLATFTSWWVIGAVNTDRLWIWSPACPSRSSLGWCLTYTNPRIMAFSPPPSETMATVSVSLPPESTYKLLPPLTIARLILADWILCLDVKLQNFFCAFSLDVSGYFFDSHDVWVRIEPL
jgi:hypothetical protein